jgi:hypothetical protein
MTRKLLLALCAVLPLAAVPATADARRGMEIALQDDGVFLYQQYYNRNLGLAQAQALGVTRLRVNVLWTKAIGPFAAASTTKPANLTYNFTAWDNLIDAAARRGIRVTLTLAGQPVPAFASGRRRQDQYKPNARRFGEFVRAAVRHFKGRVNTYVIWNEPNHKAWLEPVRSQGSIYRKLYLAGYRGLRASGNDDTILLGELMPRGGTDKRKIPPLQFLREMACLDRNYRQYRGRAAKLRECSRVRRIPTSGFAYHPYTLAGGPNVDEARDDAAIGQLGRVRATLDKLARRGKLPRRLKIWITEFGYQTRPPDPFGTPIGRAPNLMDLSEWIAFRNPRVATYAQYTLRDNDFWQSGLRRESGRPKRRVYEAFRMPLFVRSLGGNRVEVFGALRSASGGSARVESKAPGGRYRSRGSASVNRAGYFRRIFRVTNAVRHTFRVTLDGRSRTKRVTR